MLIRLAFNKSKKARIRIEIVNIPKSYLSNPHLKIDSRSTRIQKLSQKIIDLTMFNASDIVDARKNSHEKSTSKKVPKTFIILCPRLLLLSPSIATILSLIGLNILPII